tara:strand:+ start:92 stop:493 length:402 start_codon:yes stop_codon:yes gene_type:complete
MIKANELRIGNELFSGTVTSINKNSFSVFDGCSHWDSEAMHKDWIEEQPIPLTEEWLLKFGMNYTDGFSNSRKVYVKNHEFDMSHITYSENEGLLRLSNGEQKGTMLIPWIKYVHQLQNLYFALTNEELTINL